MPNTVAIVTKIDIQILHLLSQLQCLFFFSLQSCCVAGKQDEMMAGGEGWRDLSAVLHMLCHLGAFWCLCMLGRSWLVPSVHGVCAPVSVSTHLPLCLQTWHGTPFYRSDTMKVK